MTRLRFAVATCLLAALTACSDPFSISADQYDLAGPRPRHRPPKAAERGRVLFVRLGPKRLPQ